MLMTIMATVECTSIIHIDDIKIHANITVMKDMHEKTSNKLLLFPIIITSIEATENYYHVQELHKGNQVSCQLIGHLTSVTIVFLFSFFFCLFDKRKRDIESKVNTYC